MLGHVFIYIDVYKRQVETFANYNIGPWPDSQENVNNCDTHFLLHCYVAIHGTILSLKNSIRVSLLNVSYN